MDPGFIQELTAFWSAQAAVRKLQEEKEKARRARDAIK